MSSIRFALSVTALLGTAMLAAPAVAQQGPYGVLRAGTAFDSDLRLRDNSASTPASFPRDLDYKPGFEGEIGGGYDTGVFRVEGTVGYSTAKLDRKKAETGGFVADGRTKAFNLGVAGYLDIETGSVVTPYVGGGIGASRVDARLSRIGGAPAAGSRFDDKDWGFRWHLDAGLGMTVAPKTTVELGARYTRVSGLNFEGVTGNTAGPPAPLADTFKMRQSSWSALLGIRQAF